jgi:hypothetical protein
VTATVQNGVLSFATAAGATYDIASGP